MAVTAAAGILGFGAQPAMGQVAATFYRHKASQIDFAVMDDTRTGDDEIGGRPVPTFPYKAGVLVGGGFTIQPRLKSTLGWLLEGALGANPTTTGASAPYSHAFGMEASDPSMVRWMTFRKYIPRKDDGAATDVGEIYTDCKIVGLALSLGADRPISARIDVLGREFQLDHEAENWTWENDYEDYQSIPVGTHTDGYISVAGENLPIVQATVTWQNAPLDTRMERIYGSPFLEDVTIVRRQLAFDLLVKWNNPSLYAKVLTGSPTGTDWDEAPFVGAVDILTAASGEITVDNPYSLRIQSPQVMLAMNGGITLAAGQAVMMRFNGVALDPGVGQEYVTMTLKNDTASYAWPTV